MMENDITLFVGGDFYAKKIESLSFASSLQKIIGEADVSICNFEGPIKSNGRKKNKSGPSLCQDPDSPGFLESLGFNVILLANNHIMDYGVSGLKATMGAFDKATLVGAGNFEDAYQIKSVCIKGKKVGFLSLVHHEFGVLLETNNREQFGTAWIGSNTIPKLISNAKRDLDYLFIFPHAGIEHIDVPLPEWRNVYKGFIDLGADGVFASHPHVPQGWETYNNKPIFYSLGNLYFDSLKGGDYWYNGLALVVSIGEVVNVQVINTVFSNHNVDIDFSNEIENHNHYLLDVLNNDIKYNDYLLKIYNSMYDDYVYSILRSVNGFSIFTNPFQTLKALGGMFLKKGNISVLLNCLRCESHRWMLTHCLEIKRENNG